MTTLDGARMLLLAMVQRAARDASGIVTGRSTIDPPKQEIQREAAQWLEDEAHELLSICFEIQPSHVKRALERALEANQND